MKNITLITLVLAALALAPVVNATTYTLQDLNSTVQVSDTSGMVSWQVDGVEHLWQQWFWYRIGDNTPEASIGTLTLDSATAGSRLLELTYTDANNSFYIDVTYLLAGGVTGSNQSDIAEQIRIRNTAGCPLDFHFFQYSDFDLNNTISDDQAVFMNVNTVRQSDPFTVLSETVVTPPPDHREIAYYDLTLDKLNDGVATDLSDQNLTSGPGDVTWAFQWDFTIGNNSSQLISKDKSLRVPAPGAVILGLIGFGLIGRIKRRFA